MTTPTMLSKTSKRAIHFLALREQRSAIAKPFMDDEVVCGYGGFSSQIEWRERTTKIPSDVTCKDCHAHANPRPSMMG